MLEFSFQDGSKSFMNPPNFFLDLMYSDLRHCSGRRQPRDDGFKGDVPIMRLGQ